MRAGPLRYRIRIRSKPTTQSATGEETPGTPATVFDLDAEIKTDSGTGTTGAAAGGEPTVAGRISSQHFHAVSIRYRSGITPAMEVLGLSGIYKDRVFDILQVLEDQARKGRLDLKCVEYRTSATP